jgi:hypothetical protein
VDEKNLRCTISENLKRTVGLRDLHDEAMTYTLQYRYHLGRLTVTQFAHEEVPSHV